MSHDALHSMSSSWKRLANFIQDAMDSEEKTIEEWSPMALALKANAEDNPTWEQAMNGPDRDGYWTAAEEELEKTGQQFAVC